MTEALARSRLETMAIDLLDRPGTATRTTPPTHPTRAPHPPRVPSSPKRSDAIARHPVVLDTAAAADAPPAPRRAAGRRPRMAWLAALVPVAGVVLLVIELRNVDLGATFAHLHPAQLAVATAAIVVSLVAAAYNLTGFSGVRVRLRRSLLVQLAVSGIRVITPSAVSTPLIGVRFLIRQGASLSDATATVAAAQLVQFAATVGIVATLAACSNVPMPDLASPTTAGIAAGVVAALVLAAVLIARASTRIRRGLAALQGSAADLGRRARRHPGRTLGGVAASALLTLAHLAAFAACVDAVGGHVPMLTLAAIYLGAASAGSLLPTPGGVGPVEAALIAGLTGAGLPLSAATAATMLSRLVAVWLPALPGWWAMLRLRRVGLL